jgi:hypothetical protein
LVHRTIIATLGLLGLLGLAGCNNCEALAESICNDLGPEDCALWKESDGPANLVGTRRAERQCFNARFAPNAYDPHLAGARAMAAALKQIKAKQAGR